MTKKDKKNLSVGPQVIKEEAEKLLSFLGVSAECEVEEKDDVFEVLLKSEDSGIIIGHHGDTLDGLQLVLSLLVEKKLGEFRQITLDIGDYKKKRIENLTQMAQDIKERVLSNGDEVSIPMLKSWERRIIHLVLKEDDSVSSESVGEGKERVLVVKPKES